METVECPGPVWPIRILVVEDDEAFLAPLVRTLARLNCEVRWAASGAEARPCCGESDAVLLDVNLPGESGMHLLEWIRGGYPALPVILMSGRFTPRGAPKPQDLGVSAVLSKPFTPQQLAACLEPLRRSPEGIP
jgi:DNA-binding response OmpR family regulator